MNTIRAVVGIAALWVGALFLAAPGASAQTLFGATSAQSDTSALHKIDPATGAGTLVGPITGFSRVSALAFHPATGVLYGVGFNASDTHVLLRIDPATGLGAEVGPTNVATASGCSTRIPDLAFRADGALFAYAEECDQLGTLDVSTGAFTLLGDTGLGEAGNGIAFFGGTLFHAGLDGVSTLDQSTGAPTLVAALTFPGTCASPGRVNALDVQPGSGTVFASVRCGLAASSTFHLATLNVATGAITAIGATVSRLDAIAFQPAFVPLTDFRDVRRPNDITIGPDLGGTGHKALNFRGTAGAAGDAWITVYDPAPNPPPATFGSVSLAADVLIHAYNNKKGAGLLALYNQAPSKKGLALTLYSAGNTDSLVLATVDQAGKLTPLLTARLGAAIVENRWYRVTMDVGVGAGFVSVLGAVFSHGDQFDPNSQVAAPKIGSVNLVAVPLGVGALAGVDATGELGILSAAVGAANGSSVTNVSILPQDFGDAVIIFD